MEQQSEAHPNRKRKAESQDNERLSKRLSLLNIEHDGTKIYVPVESPRTAQQSSGTANDALAQDDTGGSMQLDDTKHKVYIYNIDDELSSDSDGDNDSKLVFLPDIEKRLRKNRIPPSVLANQDGELAGMQLVLYNEPKSLSIPEEKDSVRKAIIDARRRLRENIQDDNPTIPASNEKSKTNYETTIAKDEQNDMDID